MGRITVFANPIDPSERAEHAHSGPLIDWLSEHYPSGFGGRPSVCLLNGNRLGVEDWDAEIGQDDHVVLSIVPCGIETWASIGTALLAAAASTAINYAITALFPAKTTTSKSANAISGSLPTAEAVSSLSGGANLSALGDLIPVPIGRNRITPRFAMAPYYYFFDNKHHRVDLLVLGPGYYEINEIYVDGDAASSLAPGLVNWRVFTPEEHAQTFGEIHHVTGRSENVYTHAAVSDIELTAGSELNIPAYMYVLSDGLSWGTFSQAVSDWAESFMNDGRKQWLIVHDGPNEGVYQIQWWIVKQTVGHDVSNIYKSFSVIGAWPSNDATGNCSLSYNDPGSVENFESAGIGAVLGPYRMTPRGVTADYGEADIQFPAGCFAVDANGNAGGFAVTLNWWVEEVDDDDNILSERYLLPWAESYATTTPQRRTIALHPPRNAQWRVYAQRFSPLSSRTNEASKCVWTGLKGYAGQGGSGPVYGPVSLLSVDTQASEGFSGSAVITVDMTRMRQDGTPLNQFVDVFADVLLDADYGLGRPPSDLDSAALSEIASQFGPFATWDGVWTSETTAWTALTQVAQIYRCAPSNSAGLVSMLLDGPKAVADIAIWPHQIRNLTWSPKFRRPGDNDGYKVKWLHPLDNAEQYALWPEDSVSPTELELKGCRSAPRALEFAQRSWRQQILRSQWYEVQVEGIGHLVIEGALMSVTHPLLGDSPVLMVATKIDPSDDLAWTITAHRYEPGVFV